MTVQLTIVVGIISSIIASLVFLFTDDINKT